MVSIANVMSTISILTAIMLRGTEVIDDPWHDIREALCTSLRRFLHHIMQALCRLLNRFATGYQKLPK